MKRRLSNIIEIAIPVLAAAVVFYVVCVNPSHLMRALTHWGPPVVFLIGMILVLLNRKKC